jgi:murein DD-endopeptidase MepM/ murein hydrolase activator NlpD
MYRIFNIVLLMFALPVFGQTKADLMAQVLQTAKDYRDIAPVIGIIKQNGKVFKYVPSISPLMESYRISDYFGYRIHPIRKTKQFHSGVDLAVTYAATVHATADGQIIFTGNMAGYGQTVVIRHKFGFKTQYSHLTYIYCKVGQDIEKGHVIGFAGSTGISTGNHLHYEIVKNNKKINPLNFMLWNSETN